MKILKDGEPLYPVEPAGVGQHVGKLDVARRGPLTDSRVGIGRQVRGEVVEHDGKTRQIRGRNLCTSLLVSLASATLSQGQLLSSQGSREHQAQRSGSWGDDEAMGDPTAAAWSIKVPAGRAVPLILMQRSQTARFGKSACSASPPATSERAGYRCSSPHARHEGVARAACFISSV